MVTRMPTSAAGLHLTSHVSQKTHETRQRIAHWLQQIRTQEKCAAREKFAAALNELNREAYQRGASCRPIVAPEMPAYLRKGPTPQRRPSYTSSRKPACDPVYLACWGRGILHSRRTYLSLRCAGQICKRAMFTLPCVSCDSAVVISAMLEPEVDWKTPQRE